MKSSKKTSSPRRRFVILWGFAAGSCLALWSCSPLSSFRNPQVEIPVEHPPGIGLHVTQVAFAPPEGSCSNEMVGALTQTLLTSGVDVSTDRLTVTDSRDARYRRRNRETAVARSASRSIASILPDAPSTPAERGDGDAATGTEDPFAGHALLINMSDTSCDAEHNDGMSARKKTRKRKREVDGEEVEYEEEYVEITYTRETRFNLGVSVQAADWETGAIVGAKSVRRSRERTNRSTSGIPNYPSETPLRNSASNAAAKEISQWLLPWTETVRLVFYDVEECAMASAYAYYMQGSTNLALQTARESISSCDDSEIEARFRAAAHYNLGILYFIDGEQEAAFRTLLTARSVDPENGAVKDAFEHVQRAMELMEEIHQIDGLPRRKQSPETPLVYPGTAPDGD